MRHALLGAMRHIALVALALSACSLTAVAGCSSDSDSSSSESAITATDTVSESHDDFGPLRFRDIFFSYAKGTPLEANFDKLVYLAGDQVRAPKLDLASDDL